MRVAEAAVRPRSTGRPAHVWTAVVRCGCGRRRRRRRRRVSCAFPDGSPPGLLRRIPGSECGPDLVRDHLIYAMHGRRLGGSRRRRRLHRVTAVATFALRGPGAEENVRRRKKKETTRENERELKPIGNYV